MEITPQLLYWLTRCDHLRAALIPFIVVSLILSIVLALVLLGRHNDYGRAFKDMKVSIFLCGLCISVFFVTVAGKALIPTTKEMAAILVIPAVANSESFGNVGEDMGDIGSEVVGLAKDWLKELRPKDARNESAMEVKSQTSEE